MLIYRLLSVIFIGTLSDRGIIRTNWCKVTKKILISVLIFRSNFYKKYSSIEKKVVNLQSGPTNSIVIIALAWVV